jgi:hypothetical protein
MSFVALTRQRSRSQQQQHAELSGTFQIRPLQFSNPANRGQIRPAPPEYERKIVDRFGGERQLELPMPMPMPQMQSKTASLK